MTIYERIRDRRIEINLTQEELAKKVGYVSRSAVNKIEKGLRDINQTQLIKFAEALKVSAEYLLLGDGCIDKGESDNMSFGKILKQLRESNGYSMDKLVELYNIKFNGKMNKSTLSRYENELQEPMLTVIVNLAKFFNVTVDYLSGNDCMDKEDAEFIKSLGYIHQKKDSCASRIKKGLKLNNMRQIELSQKTGIPKSSISQYMSGYAKPKADRIYTISKALNVSEAWLMGYDVPMERADANNQYDSVTAIGVIRMPEIARFYGIIIKMFFKPKEHDPESYSCIVWGICRHF